MIEIKQLRDLISTVLKDVGLYSEDAVELLVLTACTESLAGTYIYQVGGPARGIFQMEPKTEEDIWKNFLAFRPSLAERVKQFTSGGIDDLSHNLEYQVVMARVHYLRVKEKLPSAYDVNAMAKYWKKYYNTNKGKGTVEKAERDYNRIVFGDK